MKNKGFTLLEITVVVSIITLLSVIFLANYRQGEKNFALQRSAHQLAQDLRRVQNIAMASREFEGTFPKGGYGVSFDIGTNPYILFADCDGNGKYSGDIGSALSCAEATEANPYPYEKIEEAVLEEGILVSELSPISAENKLNITFFPPNPDITITPSANLATITLTFGGGSEKKININTAGLIKIE